MFYIIALVLITWHFEPIPGASEDIVLDVRADTTIAVVYHDDSVLYYAHRILIGDSAIWQTEIIDSTPINTFNAIRNFSIDAQGTPHVIYHIWGQYPYWLDLIYAYRDSQGVWQSMFVDSMAWGADIVIDHENVPHVLYMKDDIWHAYLENGAWSIEYVGDGLYGGYIATTCDHDNRLYFGLGAPVCDLRQGYVVYGAQDSTGWIIDHLPQYDVRWAIGIDVSSSCIPYLCFSEFNGTAWLMYKLDNTWFPENVTGLSVFEQTLALDGEVVHILGARNDTVIHWTYTQSGWIDEGIYAYGFPRQLIARNNDNLHCLINSNGVILYGTSLSQGCQEHEAMPGCTVHRTISVLPLQISLHEFSHPHTVEIIDISGRRVHKDFIDAHIDEYVWYGYDDQKQVIGSGVYFIIITHDTGQSIVPVVIVR